MNDLDTLRPEVISALDALYNYRFNKEGFDAACKAICAELRRLADECAELHKAAARGALAHMKTQAELAALKARIANSCRADGQRVFDLLGLPIEYDGTLALVKVEE